ncbi:hypothetical protein Klosneuvirus_3_319 [Klosneuvirus KNV1]|uniref:Uncharacterized protein n=1 Tax=Klosneuvirus KNV1 TaxID=1977640 RepID=A0A1V0SKP0_9VIRU|nr:hypothetical protein Klosneuvirus_3_319 [Klosneuvirus KNV1]
MSQINSHLFYREYHGHRVSHLEQIIQTFKKLNPEKILYIWQVIRH